MNPRLFKKKRQLRFERTYAAAVTTVWDAWTRPEMLREWWGPDDTRVTDCEVDARVGGRIYLVTEAGQGMGRYRGTRWPMAGTFTVVDEPRRLVYEARSWTEGEEESSTIEHVTDLTLTDDGRRTVVDLRIDIVAVGPGARLAAFGMKWGYKQQLDHLQGYLAAEGQVDH